MTSPNTTQTILFLAANPQGTTPLRLDRELRDISEGLQRAQKRDRFKLEQRSAVRPRDIQRAMLDLNPQIIHFSGHGEGEAGLVFEDEIGNSKLVDGDALAALFELFADRLNCVVLNGCYSEVQAQAIAQHIPYVITVAISLVRFLGVLQPLELKAYDLVMRSRPAEIQDKNILVIEVDGFKEPDKGNRLNTLSDDRLDKLLQLILPYEPKIIGFDNFLSHPIDSKKYATLDESLRTGNLVAVCQAQVQNGDSYKAPDRATSVGFGDIAVDSDKIVRRHLLSMDFNSGFCSQPYALSALLANQYLEGTNQKLQLDRGLVGGKQLNFLSDNIGGYWKLDPDSKKTDHGYQVMLNYRFNSSLRDGVNSSSINDIFKLPPQELESKIKNHIVLIGTTQSYYPDFHKTPYGTIPGVYLQAQMTSQLVNAALNNRPLIWAYPFWGEIPMILLASLTGALLSWRVRKVWILLGCGGGAIAILFVSSVALLEKVGYWFPLVPTGLGFTIVCISVTIYLFRETKPA